MTPPSGGRDRLWIVGAGRLGLALGLRLHRAGAAASLAYSGRRPDPPDHPLFHPSDPRARYQRGLSPVPPDVDGILIAVPDGAIADVVAELAQLDLPPIPVLHASGSRSLDVLAPLAARGHVTGGVHALAAIADPVEGADRLRGASFGVEGEGAAREMAMRIVAGCEGRALSIRPGGKALYHAAAVFASNYAVALLAVAERLMADAGVEVEDSGPALTGLAAGAVENVAARGTAAALTGPVVRGDVETVEMHLARLSGADRSLYCLLGLEALELAAARGVDPAAAARLREMLGDSGG
ncbi:MAG TPA: DUF2520 domain-containing protein [Longimicrobium sp.]|nr:DUF2520 domain-containing protein [Longimicrobium sp.]